jgi:hypothetical protein
VVVVVDVVVMFVVVVVVVVVVLWLCERVDGSGRGSWAHVLMRSWWSLDRCRNSEPPRKIHA